MPASDDALRRAQQVLRVTQQAAEQGQKVEQAASAAQSLASAVASGDLGGVASALAGLGPVEKVQFSFEVEEDAVAQWRVVELHAREGLSELYTCSVDLANEDTSADPDTLLGGSCRVLVSRGATSRRMCGIVHRVEHLGTKAGHLLARVHLVPALWALSQRRDSYIFQEMTVPEILDAVLSEGLQPFQRTFRIEVQREYLPREYCVQYQETDLEFALRLMEEEGICFYFDHGNDHEELVLFELNSQCAPCSTALGGPVTIVGPEAGTAQDETLRSFELVQQLHSTSVVIRDFDWTQPMVDLTRKARGKDGRGYDREVYEYPAPLLGPYDAGNKRYKHQQAQHELMRRQAIEQEGKRGRGRGNISGFTPGYTFELTGHGRSALDQKYLLTRVEHFGHAPEELTSDTHELAKPSGAVERYYNTFECIPESVPFRPERKHTRARMHGLQTATVVGPQGEEVFTDEHGRIKVQFHWDREGQRNERSSCFLRVAQAWAGTGWGFMFLPRIGMEVLVDFLEGDPDRPIVIGTVYNGYNATPYALPDHKTRSTIKTLSTPRSDGFNELRFEDAAGQEEIFVHAQKDYNEIVLNNHTTTVNKDQTNHVDGNQTQSIGGSQSESVGGDQSMTVDKNRTVHVKGSQSVTIDGSQGHDGINGSKLNITGDHKLDASNKIDVQAPTHIQLTCGGSSILIEPGKITISAGGNAQLVLDANALMKSAAGSQVLLDANAFTQASGGANVLLDANALVHASGGAQVLFDANANMTSAGGSQVLLDGNAKVHGAGNATMEAPGTAAVQGATAQLTGGGGAVEAGGSGVTAAGGSVNVSGGTVSIAGGMVSIN